MNRPVSSRPASTPRPPCGLTIRTRTVSRWPRRTSSVSRCGTRTTRWRDTSAIGTTSTSPRTCSSTSRRAIPRRWWAPDVFVVLGAPNHKRRSYKVWEEPKGPDFVLEITSHSTRSADQGPKRRVYEALGVREYWLFDPTGDYLVPPLQGLRLVADDYVRLPSRISPDGSLSSRSEVLGLDLRAADGRLRLHDPATGQDLPSSEELEDRLEQQTAALRAAEARVAELEARMRLEP